jgi:hypothetical protein
MHPLQGGGISWINNCIQFSATWMRNSGGLAATWSGPQPDTSQHRCLSAHAGENVQRAPPHPITLSDSEHGHSAVRGRVAWRTAAAAFPAAAAPLVASSSGGARRGSGSCSSCCRCRCCPRCPRCPCCGGGGGGGGSDGGQAPTLRQWPRRRRKRRRRRRLNRKRCRKRKRKRREELLRRRGRGRSAFCTQIPFCNVVLAPWFLTRRRSRLHCTVCA